MVVEDDAELRSVLLRGLAEEGFETSGAATGAEALALLESTPADAIVLDIGLPDADGRDLCQALRARGVGSPVLFLTARDALTDRGNAFAAGGDDYVAKPFAFAEVIARLEALLRRAGGPPVLQSARLQLDPAAHAAFVDGERIPLSPTELRILAKLIAADGTPVSRRELLRTAWPHGALVHANTLDAYIARLRRKLDHHEGAPHIETMRGVGYRLE